MSPRVASRSPMAVDELTERQSVGRVCSQGLSLSVVPEQGESQLGAGLLELGRCFFLVGLALDPLEHESVAVVIVKKDAAGKTFLVLPLHVAQLDRLVD